MWTILIYHPQANVSNMLHSILQYSRNRFQKQCWTHRGWWFGQLTCWKVKENLKDQIKVSALGSQEVWLACAWLPQQSWGPFLNVRILPNLRNIDNLYHSTKMFNPTWFKLIVSSEFIKIKQKQKAWAVDNGLRVHEVKWNFSLLWIFTFDLLCILAEGQWRQVDDDCFPDSCGKLRSSVKRIQHYSLASRSIPLKLSLAHSCIFTNIHILYIIFNL